MKISLPKDFDASLYYTRYLSLAKGEDLFQELEDVSQKTLNTVGQLNDVDLSFSYAEGKWNIGVLLQHICDAERVYAYRALRFLRGDATDLPGFNEDDFARNCKGYERLEDFIAEYNAIRASSVQLFSNSSVAHLDFEGTANGIVFTPRIFAWLTVGHNLHHLGVLKDRYLSALKK